MLIAGSADSLSGHDVLLTSWELVTSDLWSAFVIPALPHFRANVNMHIIVLETVDSICEGRLNKRSPKAVKL